MEDSIAVVASRLCASFSTSKTLWCRASFVAVPSTCTACQGTSNCAATADALVLRGLTDGTILVIRADATPLPSAQQAIDHLGGVGGKLTGVVLNSVNIERHSYYYGPYYGDHARRYASRSEEKSPDARVVGGG